MQGVVISDYQMLNENDSQYKYSSLIAVT